MVQTPTLRIGRAASRGAGQSGDLTLAVRDALGTYTIPSIQSSRDLRVCGRFPASSGGGCFLTRERWYGEDPVHPNEEDMRRMARLWHAGIVRALALQGASG